MINNKINNFSNVGYSVIRGSFDKQKIKVLKKTIKSITPKTKHIFYSSKENFKKHARFQRITPGIYDHNILLDKRVNLEFIEKNKKFVSLITNLFKSDYYIEEKWLLKNIPIKLFPKWLKDEIKDIGMPQLNMYIKEKYRNTSYIYGLDYHQDNGGRKRNSITVIIYLDDVTNYKDTPIRILPKTHILGATQYPHYCRPTSDKKKIIYSDMFGNHMFTEDLKIYGKPGCAIIFNGYVLHGSEPSSQSSKERLALRYVLSPRKIVKSSIYQKSNDKIISGSFFIKDYRLDKLNNGYNQKCGKVLNYVK